MDGLPQQFGEFDDPADAVALAASTNGYDLTVVADGSGPYWHSGEPDRIFAEVLQRVCRFKQLTPEEAERERRREEREFQREMLHARQRVEEAIEVVRGSDTVAEARRRLRHADPSFSEEQAGYLIGALRLSLLTDEEQAAVARQLDDLD